VIFLSPLDPKPYVAAIMEQTETHTLHSSIRHVQSGFEYLTFECVELSSSFAGLSLKSTTASSLAEKCSGQTLDITWHGLLRPRIVSRTLARELVIVLFKPGLTISTRAHDGGRCA
jgi:hypothetical protein